MNFNSTLNLNTINQCNLFSLEWLPHNYWRPLYLTAAVLCVDVAWHGETSVQKLLGIIHRSLKQVAEVLILRHVLVPGFAPLRHRLHEGKRSASVRSHPTRCQIWKFILFTSASKCDSKGTSHSICLKFHLISMYFSETPTSVSSENVCPLKRSQV